MSEIITKDSLIVELFSKKATNATVEVAEYKDALDHIRLLASNPNPNNRYEIAQIIRYAVDNVLEGKLAYLDLIADVKKTEYGAKAEFEIEIDDLKAFFQAKGSTTERSKVGSKFVQLKTDEVSTRPYFNFHELAAGKVNVENVINRAADKMELEVIKKVQNVFYAAISALSAPNYASGAGVVKTTFDPIVTAMARIGKPALVGDAAILAKLTGLTGFNNNVPEALAIEHNNNGLIGTYLSGNVVKLNNPFVAGSLSNTVLRQDLIIAVPSGDAAQRPLKVHLEGEMMTMEQTNMDDKSFEVRLDKYVGVGLVGDTKYIGVYEDTTL